MNMRKAVSLVPLWAFASLVLAAPPAAAQGREAAAPAEAGVVLNATDSDRLQPGHYLWQPGLAPDGAVNIVVDLDRQGAFVYRGGTLIGISTVSTGRDGYETPVGAFTILEKEVKHRSNRYNDAPIP